MNGLAVAWLSLAFLLINGPPLGLVPKGFYYILPPFLFGTVWLGFAFRWRVVPGQKKLKVAREIR